MSVELAEEVIAFIEHLPVPAGKYLGERMHLRDWQKAFIRDVYGSEREDGTRLVRQAVLTMPRRNGKSLITACLALAHLVGPLRKPNSVLLSAANDRAQAAIVFKMAADIVRAHPVLRRTLKIIDSTKRLVDERQGCNSVYMAISADAHTKLGLGPDLVLYDELGAARNRALYDVLQSSQGSQTEPLMIAISTQASDDHHLFSQLVDYGRQVNEGTVHDPGFVLHDYSAPLDADIYDERVWFAANPALDDYRDLAEFQQTAERTKKLPASLPMFRSLYLNQRVATEPQLISPEMWNGCVDETLRIEEMSGPCVLGLDLASISDLASLVAVFPEDGWSCFFWSWVAADSVERLGEAWNAPYLAWVDQGYLIPSGHTAIQFQDVADKIREIVEAHEVVRIAADDWKLRDLLDIFLEGDEFPDRRSPTNSLVLKQAEFERRRDEGDWSDELFVQFGQGFKSMSRAVDTLEARLEGGTLRLEANPVAAWCASNLRVQIDPAGNRKPTKKSRGDRRWKIDPVVALMMAVRQAELEHDDRERYQEETRKLLALNDLPLSEL